MISTSLFQRQYVRFETGSFLRSRLEDQEPRSTSRLSTRSPAGCTETRSGGWRTWSPGGPQRRPRGRADDRHHHEWQPATHGGPEEPVTVPTDRRSGLEERTFDLSVSEKKIRGKIPYGTESRDLGGWTRVIEPTALRQAKLDDLVAAVDHAGVPIGRYPTTLDLEDRSDGMHWSLTPPQSSADVREAVERGDLRGGSWRMVVGRDEWRGDVRHVHEISELRDVSVVTTGAYPAEAAPVELRSKPDENNNNKEDEMSDQEAPERSEEQRSEEKQEETEERSALPNDAGSLRVEDREEKPKESLGGGVEFINTVSDFARDVKRGETRSLSTSITLSNPEFGSSLFDLLRPQSVFLSSGVQALTTSSDSVIYPKLTTDATIGWISEAGTITASDPVFGAGTVTPHKLAVRVVYSNELAEDSSPALEGVLRSAFAARGAVSLDVAAFEGAGTGAIPEGWGTSPGRHSPQRQSPRT